MAVTFKSLYQELDHWFLRDATILAIKDKADHLIRERFETAYPMTQEDLNEEQQFYLLLSKKLKQTGNIEAASLQQRQALVVKLGNCEQEANGFVSYYAQEAFVSLLMNPDYDRIRDEASQLHECAQKTAAAAFTSLHSLGKGFLATPSAYKSHRLAICKIYREAISQKAQAEQIMRKLEPVNLDQAAENYRKAVIANTPGPVKKVRNAAMRVFKQMPFAMKTKPVVMTVAAGAVLAAGWYFGVLGWTIAGLSSLAKYTETT